MNNNKKNELVSESLRQYNARRLREGMKQIKNDPRKQIGIPAMIGVILLLGHLMQKYTEGGIAFTDAIKTVIRLFDVPAALIGVLCYVLANGTPQNAHRIRNNLSRIGLSNAAGEVPYLLRSYPFRQKATYRQVEILEFLSCGITKSIWEDKKAAIETALNVWIAHIEEFDGKKGIRLYVVPVEQGLTDKIIWRNDFLNYEFPECKVLLGESLLESVSIDLNVNPHLLIGGGTGSGKTVLLRLILMQLLMKKNVKVTIADFKGGVDFSSCWKEHPDCNMVFDRTSLLTYLDGLVDELNRRKQLFASKDDCNNIFDYNSNPLYTLNHTQCLDRIVFAVDEVAEVLDKTGLSKEEKEQVARIESRIATIARLGRAFGIHLILATQRPDANILTGQIKNNISYRVCGRADSVLSMIILDSTDAAEQIPSDARGRFIDNNGIVFQGYWFDESKIDWNAQL